MALPNRIIDAKELLTLHTRDLPVYEDVYGPGVSVQPLFLDAHGGVWVLRLMFRPGVKLPLHYHTGPVHLFTLSGRWNYAEYPNQPQTAGSYLFEPGGSVHALEVPPDNTETTDMIAIVSGANLNFAPDGTYLGVLDASEILTLIDRLIRERGLDPVRTIAPSRPQYSTAG